MPKYPFRILIESITGEKFSYHTASFVDTGDAGNRDLVLSSSQVYDRITGSFSASYQNQSIFSGSDLNTSLNTSFTFKDNNLLSASLSGSAESGSIIFSSTDTEYDRLLRYKFFGEKVCNVLGLPAGEWVYVDQFRLPSDDESNYFEGNVSAKNVFVRDDFTFAGTSNLASDLPIFVNTGSDRYIKFIDSRGIDSNAVLIGYDDKDDVYEISSSSDHVFNIEGVNSYTGSGMKLTGELEIASLTASADIDVRNITASGDIAIGGGSSNTPGSRGHITLTGGGGIGFPDNRLVTIGLNSAGHLVFDSPDGVDNNIDRQVMILESAFAGNAPALGINVTGNTAPKTLTVGGDMSGSGELSLEGNITASGNISSSGTIIANSMEVTHLTSSFVTSSTILSEGSNTFGDDPDDRHEFTGSAHFSGSVNISNPGNGSEIFLEGQAGLTRDGVSLIQVGNVLDRIQMFGGESVSKFSSIQFDNAGILITSTNAMLTSSVDISSSGFLHINHITSSGNISASGIIFASASTQTGLDKLVTYNTTNGQFHITASSAFEGGGGGSADNLGNHTATQDLDLDGNDILGANTITASGNISSSGEVSADTIVVGSTITHIGDSNTKITFTDDDINLTAAGKTAIDITYDGDGGGDTREITFNEGHADIDVRIEGDTDANLLFTNAGTDRVGVGTNSPSSKLEVDGDITATNITASANISASGDVLTNNVFINGENALKESSGKGFLFDDAQITELQIGKQGTVTQTFISGEITASGNISSSATGTNVFGGDILLRHNSQATQAPSLQLRNDINHVAAQQSILFSSGSPTTSAGNDTARINYNPNVSARSLSIDNFISNGVINLRINNSTQLQANADGVDVTGTITTLGGVHVGGTSSPGADNLIVDGQITASNNISASGTITANQYGGNVSGSLTSTGSFGALIGQLQGHQTKILSIRNTALEIGRDSGNNIDFGIDNQINHFVNDNQLPEFSISAGKTDVHGNLSVSASVVAPTAGHITASSFVDAVGCNFRDSLRQPFISQSGNSQDFTLDIGVGDILNNGGGGFFRIFNNDGDEVEKAHFSSMDVGVKAVPAPGMELTVAGDISQSGNFITEGTITASGDISSSGTITSNGGTFTDNTSIIKNNNGDDVSFTIRNSAGGGSTDETTTLKFGHNVAGAGGKLVSGRDGNYNAGAVTDSNLQFFTSTDGSDTEKMRISSTGEISASGGITSSGLHTNGDIIGATATIGAFSTSDTNDATITRDLTIGRSLVHDGDVDTIIQFDTEKITAVADSIVLDGNITASGNISASGGAHTLGGDSETVLLVNHPKSGSLIEVKANAESGSVVLSGSLALKNNAVKPIQSSSRIFNSGSNLFFGKHAGTTPYSLGPKVLQTYSHNFSDDPSTTEHAVGWPDSFENAAQSDDSVAFLCTSQTNVRHVLMRGQGFDQNLGGTITWRIKTHSPYGLTAVTEGNWTTQETTIVTIPSSTDTGATNLIYAIFSGSHGQPGDLLNITFQFSADFANGFDEFYVSSTVEHDYCTLPNLGFSTGSMPTGSAGFGVAG